MRPPLGGPWAKALPWAAASIPFLFLVAWFWDRGPGLDADDYGLTLMHAEALVEGRPYWDTGYIPTRLDVAPPVQPPGLPLVVAMAMAVGGESNMEAIRAAMALAAFPFFLLAGLVFARSHGTATGLAVMVMLSVALAGRETWGATQIQSDLGFASLVWSVIYLLDRGGAVGWPRVVAVFALASAAMAYRYLGAALIPTVALFALVHTRARRFLVPVGTWAAGGIAAIAAAGWGTITSQISLDPTRLWRRFLPIFRTYRGSAIEAHLYPFPWDLANDAFHVVSLSLGLLGLLAWTRTGWRSAAWLFTACYLLLLFFAYNRAGRYLVPVFPILIFGLLHGSRLLLSVARRHWSEGRVSNSVAAAGVVLATSTLVVLSVRQPRTGGYLYELPEAASLFDYLRAQPGDTRVAFTEPRVLSWRTGIPATVIPGVGPGDVMPELDHLEISHVVLNRIGLEAGRVRAMQATIETYPCRFEPTFDNGSFEVYRVLPPCEEGPPL
jgi:hypothetical protein